MLAATISKARLVVWNRSVIARASEFSTGAAEI